MVPGVGQLRWSARRGTLRRADIVASQLSCRWLRELVASDQVPGFEPLQNYHPARCAEAAERLCANGQRVFTVAVRQRYSSRQVHRLRPEHRLIKEIYPNRLLRRSRDHFQATPPRGAQVW